MDYEGLCSRARKYTPNIPTNITMLRPNKARITREFYTPLICMLGANLLYKQVIYSNRLKALTLFFRGASSL